MAISMHDATIPDSDVVRLPSPEKVLSGTLYGVAYGMMGRLDPTKYLHDPLFEDYKLNKLKKAQ